MLNNKRGLSEAVMTVIMIALVLVAVGVIWVVVQNVINKQAGTIDYNQKCFGIDLDVAQPVYTAGPVCTTVLTRATTSSGEAISGVSVTFSSATVSGGEFDVPGNVGSTVTVSNNTAAGCPATTTKASLRWYFLDTANVKHYCPAIATYPAA